MYMYPNIAQHNITQQTLQEKYRPQYIHTYIICLGFICTMSCVYTYIHTCVYIYI